MAGYFTDASMIRRVHREFISGIGGARGLLMQATHPVAFAGFFMSTGALADPYPRLERTARLLDTIMFGEREDADRQTEAVRRVHARTRGTLPEAVGRFPAGTPWGADDPDLLLWIIATLADSGVLVWTRYVEALSAAERDAYWEDWRLIGSLFGLADGDMPRGWDGLSEYMGDMLAGDTLHLSRTARDLGRRIVLRPPVPLAFRPLLEVANFVVIGLLPPRIRRMYRFWWDPVRSAALLAGQESTRRLLLPAIPAGWRVRTPTPLDDRPFRARTASAAATAAA